MHRILYTATVVLCLLSSVIWLGGCSLLPEIRVFQKKIPGELAEKPAAQVEGERRAAAYISLRSAPPVADPAAAVVDIHAVASRLSASLGEPAKPVTAEDKDAIIADLRGALAAKEKQLEQWKTFARKFAGKRIEGTGIDLLPFLGTGGFVAVIALCVFVPGVGWVLLRLVPVLAGALRRIIAGVEAFAVKAPEAAATLKTEYLSRKMDTPHKTLVRQGKRFVTPSDLELEPAS